jgi:hypothetical protein
LRESGGEVQLRGGREGLKEGRVGRVVHVADDDEAAVRPHLGGDDRRCDLALAPAELVRPLPLGVRVGRVEGDVVAFQVVVEEREEALALARAQDLDLEEVAREDGLSRIEPVGNVLPGGYAANRQLRE